MSILYTPVDVKFELPLLSDLSKWIDDNKTCDKNHWTHSKEQHDWAFIASRYNITNWKSFDTFNMWQANREFDETLPHHQLHPSITEIFPGLSELLLQLPFKQIGMAGFLRQLKEIPLHYDTHDATLPLEPRRFLIYMSEPSTNTFYLHKNKVNYPIKIHDEYRVFAFNSTEAMHGAHVPQDEKILLSVVGILDHSKHEELIKQSLITFKHSVVQSN